MQTMSKPRNTWRIGIPIALIVIVVSGLLTWWFLKPGANKAPVNTNIHVSHPAVEAPVSTHRAYGTTMAQTATKTNPWGSAIDAQRGFIWVAEPGCEALPTCHSTFATNIGKYSQADGSLIQNYPEPAGYSNPVFLAPDAAGNIWFTQPDSDAIGRLSPQDQIWKQWKVKKGSAPFDILVDKNGNIWFSGAFSGSIGVYRPADGTSSKYRVATLACAAVCTTHISGIAIDKKGNVWFTDSLRATIGYFVPATGAVHLQTLTKTDSHPHDGLNIDNNNTVWFTEQNNFALVMWPNATFYKTK